MAEARIIKLPCLASTRVCEQSRQEQELEEAEDTNGEISNDVGNSLLSNEQGHKEELDGVDEAQHITEDGSLVTRSSSESSSQSDSTRESEPSDDEDDTKSSENHASHYTSCIQEAQLSPDGTCIFTSDFNRSFSVYPVDIDLQSETNTRPLKPYARFTSADPIWSFAVNPYFDLNDANSTHVLVSRRDRYITLHNAVWDMSQDYSKTNPNPSKSTEPIDISTPITSYKLINPLTEAVIAPLSLTYSHTGTHFFAGHRNAIATFDLQHPSSPITTITTIPSARSKLKGGGRGFKGPITSLALSPPTSHNLVAAGSRTRNIGIYAPTTGAEITTLSLPGTLDGRKLHPSSPHIRSTMGDGITSLQFSKCGTYLYVAERQSDALLLYDVRNFSMNLAYCMGRRALTKQKLAFDIRAHASEGLHVWAGGADGMLRVWRDPHLAEGAVQPHQAFVVGDGGGPVVGTVVHQGGDFVVAACGKVEIGHGGLGRKRGGDLIPRYSDWGSLDILGFGLG